MCVFTRSKKLLAIQSEYTIMKRREELPLFKKLPYTFDAEKILKDFELLEDKKVNGKAVFFDDLTVKGGYGDTVGKKAPKLEKAFSIGEYTEYIQGMVKGDYKQVGVTEFNEESVDRDYVKKIGSRPDERHYNKLKPQLRGTYLESVLNTFIGETSRCRIAIMKPGGLVKPHIDYNTDYSVRYHIPLKTNNECGFQNQDKNGNIEQCFMDIGECWFLNQGFKHSAWNNGDTERWHLIVSVLTQEDLDA